MKLSDMFSTLADNARSFEAQVHEWQDQLTSRNSDMLDSARKWQETTMQRQEEMAKQMQVYFDEAGENVRSHWETMQKNWEEQFRKMQERGEEMREAAKKSGHLPEWAEAYAAQMISAAQKMQNEAADAIAAAAEARGTKKKGGSTKKG